MKFEPLGREFFERETVAVARDLLGQLLVRNLGKRRLIGRIVEVEAYLPENDPSAHAAAGRTKRTEVIFGPAGHAYVYRIHQYHCLNVTAETDGIPGCALIRAVEGIADGPGKLCRAMEIDLKLYGADLTKSSSPLFIARGEEVGKIMATPRIGISKAKDLKLRFVLIGDTPNSENQSSKR